MVKGRYAAIPFLMLALVAGGTGASPVIQGLLDELSVSDYQGYVQSLEAFDTRYFSTPGNDSARLWLSDTFESFGLAVRQDPYIHDGATRYNVEASLTGRVNPDRIMIVGAHFDSISNNKLVLAPGADDNASGVAAILEMASVLAGYGFESTIRFVAFNSEEQGLIGSAAYAASALGRGDNIVSMINFDMIGYTGSNLAPDLELMGDDWLVDSLVASAAEYVPDLLTESFYGNYYGSDHYYFHSSLYPGASSLLAIEDTPNEIWGGSNPYYHSTTDTSGHLDWDFAFRVTQAGAGALAELAGFMPAPAPPVALLLLPGLLALWSSVSRRRLRP